MGSTPKAPPPIVAPAESNISQVNLLEEQYEQQELLMEQQQESNKAQIKKEKAEVEMQKGIDLREAETEYKTAERERRMSKGRADLLYGSRIGVTSKASGTSNGKVKPDVPMSLLGGY